MTTVEVCTVCDIANCSHIQSKHNPLETLRALHASSTPGAWGKGKSTHETVAHRMAEPPYRVAEFRHSDDAAFCDGAHALVPDLVKHLGDLLAIIHRDGGHYVAEHGLDKAVQEAKCLVHRWRNQIENPVTWIAFKDSPPPQFKSDGGKIYSRVLVTNNLTARTRFGDMSHVWVTRPFNIFGQWQGYADDGHSLVEALTHWARIPGGGV